MKEQLVNAMAGYAILGAVNILAARKTGPPIRIYGARVALSRSLLGIDLTSKYIEVGMHPCGSSFFFLTSGKHKNMSNQDSIYVTEWPVFGLDSLIC